MSKFKMVAIEAAKVSGEILKQNLGKKQKIDFKGRIDLVTEMDKASQKKIITIIKKNFPEHGILAEEGDQEEIRADYKWLIDPLDGTTNYAHGYPFFNVSIALEKEGEIILGVVYNPMLKELFVAEKGKGAYLNGKKISVSKISKLEKSFLATGFPYDIKENPNNNLKYFISLILRSQAVRRDGSAALDMCYVAMGRYDGFWELRLSPWDSAAGTLVIKEAGGKVTDFEGKPYNIYKKELVASNGKIHKQLLSALKNSPEIDFISLGLRVK